MKLSCALVREEDCGLQQCIRRWVRFWCKCCFVPRACAHPPEGSTFLPKVVQSVPRALFSLYAYLRCTAHTLILAIATLNFLMNPLLYFALEDSGSRRLIKASCLKNVCSIDPVVCSPSHHTFAIDLQFVHRDLKGGRTVRDVMSNLTTMFSISSIDHSVEQ